MRYSFIIICSVLIIVFSSCFKSKQSDNEMFYEGIYFTYPSSWNASGEQIGEEYLIYCFEKIFKNSTLTIRFFPKEGDPEAGLNSFIESMRWQFNSMENTPVKTGKFGKYNCLYAEYNFTNDQNIKFYGIMYAFNIKGKHFIVQKESKIESGLEDSKFDDIENSFNILDRKQIK